MPVRWSCGDCRHSETAPIGTIPGDRATVTVGAGRRETTVETAVCPNCGSHDWHSRQTRAILPSPTNP